MNWLQGLEVRAHDDKTGVPDWCPFCGEKPYPAGTCQNCGATRPKPRTYKVFAKNSLPALLFAVVCLTLGMSSIIALFIVNS